MSLPRLMLVTDRSVTRGRSLAAVAREVSEALDGEVFVQLREKDLGDEELLALATDVLAALGAGAVMAVNDRVAVATALGVGLHLPAVAMRRGDDPRPLGRSVHDADEALVAVGDGVDYAVVGTIFPTSSKPGHRGDGLEHLGRDGGGSGADPVLRDWGDHAGECGGCDPRRGRGEWRCGRGS